MATAVRTSDTPKPKALSNEEKEKRRAVRESFGARLQSLFHETEQNRQEVEQEWLKDLRQYKGQYEPDVLAKISKKRSRAFIRLTRTKVKTTDARVTDMLFPGGSDKNWHMTESPVSEVDPRLHATILQNIAFEKVEALAAQLQALPPEQIQAMSESGGMPDVPSLTALIAEQRLDDLPKEIRPTEDESLMAVNEFAKESAQKMSDEIEDQLTEAKYEDVVRDVIHSGHLFGTGVLKGPLVEKRTIKHWMQGRDEKGNATGWTLHNMEINVPFMEFVPIWDTYPDMSTTDLGHAEFIFQRYVMTRAETRKLSKRPFFDQEAINKYVKENPEGDAKYKTYETELRGISKDQVYHARERRRKYEVLEYWGNVDGMELQACGCEVDEDLLHLDFEANVWMLGNTIIRAILNPSDAKVRPYHFYYFEKDETSIFGNSIPWVIRDPQSIFNSSIRATLDNAAISAGPQVEVNVDLLDDDENVEDLFPFRIWLRHGEGINAQYPAVRVTPVPNYSQAFLQIADVSKQLLDETSTLPSYTHGEQDKGVAKTVGGLSMLMGAAAITLKDVVRNFDNGITKPFITAMYHWNMQFNEREDIKGDYEVKARGSSSLMAKELHAQRLELFAANTKDPIDGPYIKRAELNQERAQALDLDADKFVRTEDEIQADARQQLEALLQRLQAAGINPAQLEAA